MTTANNGQGAGMLKVKSYQSIPLDKEDPDGNQIVRCVSEGDERPQAMQEMLHDFPGHARPPATRRVIIEVLVDDESDRRLHEFIHQICARQRP
jgi:hypothetical protein